MTKNGKATSRLNHEEFYRLVQWIATHAEELMTEKPTFIDAARRAAKDLDLPGGVSPDHSLKQAMKLACVEWEPSGAHGYYPRASRKLFDEMTARLELLEGRLRQQEARDREQDAELAVLRGLVHHLYRQLDASAPKGYTLPPPEAVSIYSITGREQDRLATAAHQ